MQTHTHSFTRDELLALKMFYSGVRARQIRQTFCDPWPLLARHRQLPGDCYKQIMTVLAELDDSSEK